MNTTASKSRQRLLVIKHGALGDLVQGFDAFASLRNGHPDAHIALLTTPPFLELANMMPWFDEVLIDRRAGLANILAGLKMRHILRDNWDIILDLQCSQRTARYFQFFARPDTRWIGTVAGCSDPCPDFTGVNNHKRMLIAADMAGGVAVDHDLAWLSDGEGQIAAGYLATPYAVLVPGCSRAKPQKRWPAENFANLALALQKKGLAVALVGTDAERDVVDMVRSLAPESVDLCGKTSIAELARLCAASRYVIGNDTGPVFLAAASGAPTLMVMGPDTDPAMSAPTGARCGWIQADPISKLTVDDVMDGLKDLPADF